MTTSSAARIGLFKYEWAFLSNFYPCILEYEGDKFSSLEHAYQAAKVAARERWILTTANPRLSAGQAKRIGGGFKTRGLQRPDWQEVSLGVMRALLEQKFADPALRAKLAATAPAELVEGNWWHDTFWGVCTGGTPLDGRVCREGQHEPGGLNHLGRMLMEIRSAGGAG